MRQLDASVLEEVVGRLPEVSALHANLGCSLISRRLKLRMLQDHVAHLEEHHLAANRLDQRVGALQGRDEARLCGRLLREIVRQVVEQVQDEIVALVEVDKEVLRLRHKELLRIRHDKHLRLLQDGLQVVELDVLIVCEEAHVHALTSHARQQLLLDDTLERGARIRQVARLNSRLRNVESEAVGGSHRRPIHVLVDTQEVDSAAAELGAFVVVRAISISLNGALIILGSHVDVATEGANPALAIIDPAHKRINVSTAFFASHDWLVLEVDSRYFGYGSLLILN